MKEFYKSKTIWFGILQIVFAGVGFVFKFIEADVAYTLFLTGAGAIGFRLNTTKAIE
jgi:hypothetical protein